MKTVLYPLLYSILLLGLISATPTARAQSTAPGDYVVARDTPDWYKDSFLDFAKDVAEAADDGKRLMIYFGQDGCPYCKKLHDTSFSDDTIVGILTTHFDSIAVNIFGDLETVWTDGSEATEKELAARLGIQFTPTLLFLDEDGNVIVRVNGYRPPQWIRTALQYITEKQDKQNIDFDDYMREHNSSAGSGVPPIPAAFTAPQGDLHAPGKRTMVYVSASNCAMCDEWYAYLNENAGKWHDAFHLVALNRFGSKAASSGSSETEWARDNKIAFTPALIFLQEDGEEFFRAEAYLRPFHLESVIAYAESGATSNEPEFQRFLQTRADTLRERGEEVKIW